MATVLVCHPIIKLKTTKAQMLKNSFAGNGFKAMYGMVLKIMGR